MFELDLAKLPSEIAVMFMVRSGDAVPLQWQQEPNRRGKNTLDDISDERLFEPATPSSPLMASAVRALLYLWNGWPDEARMHAGPAPTAERLYIWALCERMIGHNDTAAELFKELGQHPISPALRATGLDASEGSVNPLIRRFNTGLQKREEWDHLLFIDLFDQARVGRLDLTNAQIVAKLQIREFELLFAYCYQAATGVAAPAVPKREAVQVPKSRWKKDAGKRKPLKRRPVPPKKKKEGPQEPNEPAPDARARTQKDRSTMTVLCPRCSATLILPAAARGKTVRCVRCQGTFATAPVKKESSRAASPSRTSDVWIRCPMCGETHQLPPASRGTVQACTRCGTKFSVPNKQPAGSRTR